MDKPDNGVFRGNAFNRNFLVPPELPKNRHKKSH